MTIEAGKILQEGLGEVQEMIDICDFAVGLSRQLYGLTIASERPGHRMMETWHPLGVVGVITRLQLPGRGLGVERGAGARLRRCRWSGSRRRRRRSPRSPCEAHRSSARCARFGDAPERPARSVVIGGRERRRGAGRRSQRVPLVSATGSTAHGPRGGARGRGALRPRASSSSAATTRMIVAPSADLDLAVRAIAVRRRRHRRPALHHAAPPDRARSRSTDAGARG